METLVLGWYVMVNTGSVLLLTAFGALQFLGTLAAPMFGVLGDRLGGRVMLCAMRAIYAVLAAVLAGLALAGLLTPAWVLVVTALSGRMLLAFLINLTAYPVSGGLLPYVAQRVYHVDATGLGWLVASFAFGGLLASLTMVLTGGPRHPERATLIYTAIWYALLIA